MIWYGMGVSRCGALPSPHFRHDVVILELQQAAFSRAQTLLSRRFGQSFPERQGAKRVSIRPWTFRPDHSTSALVDRLPGWPGCSVASGYRPSGQPRSVQAPYCTVRCQRQHQRMLRNWLGSDGRREDERRRHFWSHHKALRSRIRVLFFP